MRLDEYRLDTLICSMHRCVYSFPSIFTTTHESEYIFAINMSMLFAGKNEICGPRLERVPQAMPFACKTRELGNHW